MALVGHMQIDSMLPTTPFSLLVDADSSYKGGSNRDMQAQPTGVRPGVDVPGYSHSDS